MTKKPKNLYIFAFFNKIFRNYCLFLMTFSVKNLFAYQNN